MKIKWKQVTIFISSTFNDMHAERDYLVKDVFPELREWCEERKLHLVDIDLRWGVTEEVSNSNHTVLACLHNIDESRPFFLCFLGQRRGWVPRDVSLETLKEYPDIAGVLGQYSITEMEIEHALLSPMRHIINGKEQPEVPVTHALFYFRKPDYLSDLTSAQKSIFTNAGEDDEDLSDRELETFKEKIKEKWKYTTNYDCEWNTETISPELLKIRDENGNTINRTDGAEQGRLADFISSKTPLKDIILQQLKTEIIKEFPDRTDEVVYVSALDKDLEQQALFEELNCEGFIPRTGDFDDINDYITNVSDNLFILTAPAGYGKSMLLANFIKTESKKHNARFFNRFCGASELCSQQYSLWKTVFDEANIECPDTLEDIKDNIDGLLEELSKEKTVLVIDAINQLPNGVELLDCLPKHLPQNLKIILSVKDDETLKKYKNVRYSSVKPFESPEEKEKLINAYLKKYLKALDKKQIAAICNLKGSGNPLYLKILLSELRIFGSFDQIMKKIQSFGETPQEAFNAVLNRLEQDVNSLKIDSMKFVPMLFGLLANARNGLSESELEACVHKALPLIVKEKLLPAIRLFMRQVKPFMARREARADYFYETFKLAAKERYAEGKIFYNEVLADYFMRQTDPIGDLSFKGKHIRDFNELPYHFYESGNTSALEKILSAYRWVRSKMELSDIFNTIFDYSYTKNDHVELIKDTLVNSSHVLKEHIRHNLPSQLWGRLKEVDIPEIRQFLEEIEEHTSYPWLRPRHHIHGPGVTLTGLVGYKCFSGDGRYIALGAKDYSIRIWDRENRKEIAKLEGHTNRVVSMHFSRNGQLIASGSRDNTVRVWDWEKQKEIVKLEGHTEEVNTVCFSGDGQYVSSGSGGFFREDNTVRVWSWKHQKEVARLEGHITNVHSVCFSDDGRYIASGAGSIGTGDYTVRVWDWEKQEEITVLKGHTGQVNYVCFSNDGRYIASGAEDMTVRIWDWKNESEIRTLRMSHACSVCFSGDGRFVAAGLGSILNDYTIRVWDWKAQKEISRLEGHKLDVNNVCFSGDGQYIFSGSDDNTVRVWDWKKHKLTEKTGHKYCVRSLCFSPDGYYFSSGSGDGVRIWDWESEKTIIEPGRRGNGVCFSNDGRYFAYASSWVVNVWDWKNEKQMGSLYGSTHNLKAVCFSGDGNYLAVAEGGEIDYREHNVTPNIYVWDMKTREKAGTLKGHVSGVNCVCFSTDGQYIASASGGMVCMTHDHDGGDNTVRIWDWKNEKEIRKLKGHADWIHSVSFLPDGRHIVTGSANQICIWDWENEKKLFEFSGDTENIFFTGDGRYIVAGARSIGIWDWGKQEEAPNPIIMLNTEVNTHYYVTTSCAISSDNQKIVAGGSNGQILMYDIMNLHSEKIEENENATRAAKTAIHGLFNN